ncbi:MAG: AraC family transcriptional regulator [Acutalibacteraceae bacterium]|nr:AraC family transcriptional regulator [Acutalibacteraceae bacterium]
MNEKILYRKDNEISENEISVSKRYSNKSFELHTHDFFEIEIIISGFAEHTVNGNTYQIGKGDIYMLSPSDFHALKVIEPLEYINIMFTENAVSYSLLYELISYKNTVTYRLDSNEYNKILPLFTLLTEEAKKPKKHSADFTKNLCECIMISIIRHLKNSVDYDKRKKSIYSTLLYINRNFRSEISLDMLADEAGMSRNYFSSQFNKVFGTSVSSYITDIRLEYAKNLICNANNSITAACFNAGFGSFSTFSREFKKKYGLSPSEYKKIK